MNDTSGGAPSDTPVIQSGVTLEALAAGAAIVAGSGLRLLFSREPVTIRRVIESLLLWTLIVELGSAVARSNRGFRRRGMQASWQASIESAGILGLVSGLITAKKGNHGKGLAISNVDLATVGVPPNVLKTLGNALSAIVYAAIGALGTVAGFMTLLAPKETAETEITAPPPTAVEAATPFFHLALLGGLLATRGGRHRSSRTKR